MSDGTNDGPSKAEAQRDTPTLHLVVAGVFDLLQKIVSGVLDRWVVLAVIAVVPGSCLYYVHMLPEAERGPVGRDLMAAFTSGALDLVAGNLFSLGGWVLAGLVAIGATVFFRVQNKRIQDQGAELSKHRSEADPQRLSSRNPEALEDYRVRVLERSAVDTEAGEPSKKSRRRRSRRKEEVSDD